jgi:CRP-like cAMP-binding protein
VQVESVSSSLSARPAHREVGPVQRALILKTFPGFAALAGHEVAVLASITRERSFQAGEVIHEPGTPVIAFYLTVTGDVQVYHDGKPSKLFGPRSSIGGLASLTRDPAGSHAVAVTDVLALEVDADDMQDVFEDNYRILLGVMRALATGLRQAQIQSGGGAAVAHTSRAIVVPNNPLNFVERMFFYRQTSNFASASIEALADMVQDVKEQRYAPGDRLWAVGDMADASVLVVDGEIECSADGVAPFVFGQGFVVGGLDSLAQETHWYEARAKTPLRVLSLERTHLIDVLEDHVEMAMDLMRNLAKGVQALFTQLAIRQSEMPPAPSSDEGEHADE